MSEVYDYSAFRDEAPHETSNSAARLAGLAHRQVEAEALVAGLEARLKEAKAALVAISEGELPALMDELELEEYKTSNGLKIKIREAIRGSIPKANEEGAFGWLEEKGHERLIKRSFTIEFGKDEETWANRFEGDLKRRKRKLMVKRKKAVAPPTLQSFIKEQLSGGVAIPMDLFGVFRQRTTKVEVPER